MLDVRFGKKTYGGVVGHWSTVMQVINKQQN